MARIRIEMDRGAGWEVRQFGDADVTDNDLRLMLPRYAIRYPHRAFRDGKLIATVKPQRCREIGR